MWEIRAKGVMNEGTALQSDYYIVKHWYGPDAGTVTLAFIDSYPADMRIIEIQVKEAKRYEGQEKGTCAAVS